MTTPIPHAAQTADQPAAATLEALQEIGTLTPAQTATLRAALHHRRNIVIIGTPRSGRTTLLKALIHAMTELDIPTSRIGLVNAGPVNTTPFNVGAASPSPSPGPVFDEIQTFGRKVLAGDVGQSLTNAGLTRIAVDDLLDNSPTPYGTRSLITFWQRSPGGIATIPLPELDHRDHPIDLAEYAVMSLASHFLRDTQVPPDPSIVPSWSDKDAQQALFVIQQSVDLVVHLEANLPYGNTLSGSPIRAHLSRVPRLRQPTSTTHTTSTTRTADTTSATSTGTLTAIARNPLLH